MERTSSSKHSRPSSDGDSEDIEASRINIFLHAENTRLFAPPPERRLPVCVVTGFLGSGKTTLLNHVLTNRSNLRVAAAINDFADLNIDEKLIRSGGGASDVVELSNGCVCCRLLDDLKEAVWTMLQRGDDADGRRGVDYLLVETSGVSNPQSVIRSLDATFGKMYRARLDSVVTVVDADQFLHSTTAGERSAAAEAQIRCADVVILNKMDLLSEGSRRDDAERAIRELNPDADVRKSTKFVDVPLSAILGVEEAGSGLLGAGLLSVTHERTGAPLYVSATGGELRRNSSLSPSERSLSKPGAFVSSSLSLSSSPHLAADRFDSASASIDSTPLSLARLSEFLTSLATCSLARMKGVLWIRGLDKWRCVVHLSGRGRLGFELDGKWDGPPLSEIAFIGRQARTMTTEGADLVVIRRAFLECCDDSGANRDGGNGDGGEGLAFLRAQKEFRLLDNVETSVPGLRFFRLTGSEVYGYTDEQIERDLRIDTDMMQIDLADAVNASLNPGGLKAFLAYTRLDNGQAVLCYPGSGRGGKVGWPPSNDAYSLVREARKVLAVHFRNVPTCKCGA